MKANYLLRVILAAFLALIVAGCGNETNDLVLENGGDSVGIPLAALMAIDSGGPHGNYRFAVEIDGVEVASFSEAMVLEVEVEIIEYRNGNEANPATPHKLPGIVRYGDLVLKRGVTDNTALFEWFKQVLDGDIERKNMSVILYDNKSEEVARWIFFAAWPRKYIGPDLDALGNEIAIEEIIIVHEKMEID